MRSSAADGSYASFVGIVEKVRVVELALNVGGVVFVQPSFFYSSSFRC